MTAVRLFNLFFPANIKEWQITAEEQVAYLAPLLREEERRLREAEEAARRRTVTDENNSGHEDETVTRGE